MLSKPLGGGFPIAAVVADDRLKQLEPTGEDVYTFGSNPVAQAGKGTEAGKGTGHLFAANLLICRMDEFNS